VSETVTVRLSAATAAEYTQAGLQALLASKGLDTRTMTCRKSDHDSELIYSGYRIKEQVGE